MRTKEKTLCITCALISEYFKYVFHSRLAETVAFQ